MKGSEKISVTVPAYSGNYTKGRTQKIQKITVHHMAAVASAEACGRIFQVNGRMGSAHYGIGNDGRIGQYVSEADTAWSDSDWNSNCRSVSIEVSNSSTGEDWPVSDNALDSLVLLCADIALRNGLGKLVAGENLTWHQMYAATACPGPYLISRMDYIAREANKLNSKGNGILDGVDIPRGEDSIVLYFKGDGKTSGTNRWGYEVPVDRNGVVLETPRYGGSTPIPEKGKVLSGHGEGGRWIRDNIKKGYLVWFENGRIQLSATEHKSADGVNVPRLADQLIVYTKSGKAPTNKWGSEVMVYADGKAGKPVYGVGGMMIPEGGLVLSGHGEASRWILEKIKEGSRVSFDGRVVSVR